MCQPGLGACVASLSSPGRLVLSDLIRAGNRQLVNVRQDIQPLLTHVLHSGNIVLLAAHLKADVRVFYTMLI